MCKINTPVKCRFNYPRKRKRHFKEEQNVIQNNNEIIEDLTFANVSVIAEELMKLFTEGTYDKIVLVYNSFKNVATQIIMRSNFTYFSQSIS